MVQVKQHTRVSPKKRDNTKMLLSIFKGNTCIKTIETSNPIATITDYFYNPDIYAIHKIFRNVLNIRFEHNGISYEARLKIF